MRLINENAQLKNERNHTNKKKWTNYEHIFFAFNNKF